jgi:sortase A
MSTGLQKVFGRALIVAGALVLGFWGQLAWKQFCVQRSALHTLQREISRAKGTNTQNDAVLGSIRPLTRQTDAEIIGRLEIPRIHISVVVLEGSSQNVLDVAAGHVEGTALPGTVGNVAIAAHRDSFFHSLREIRTNDVIHLKTVMGDFQYMVENTEIVDPVDIEVLHRTVDPELTLITCYPFHYIGSAPKRFIVHARQAAKS